MSAVVDDIVRRLSAAAGDDVGIAGSVLKFDGGEDGVVRIDATSKPVNISSTDGPADCTIKMAAPALLGIIKGEMSCGGGYMRFVRGVEGNQALGVLVQPFFRRVAESHKQQ
jgi:hypothetical protein